MFCPPLPAPRQPATIQLAIASMCCTIGAKGEGGAAPDRRLKSLRCPCTRLCAHGSSVARVTMNWGTLVLSNEGQTLGMQITNYNSSRPWHSPPREPFC